MLTHFSHVHLFVTLWAMVHSAPLSMQFSGKITGVCCRVLQGIFPTQGLNPRLSCLLLQQVDSLALSPPRNHSAEYIFAQSCPDSATPWTVASQAPLSMGILQARILEWVAIPRDPRGLPNPEVKPGSPALQTDSSPRKNLSHHGSSMYTHTHHIFIHSSVDGHLGCFHVLAIVNSAEVNTLAHVFLN